MELGLRPRYSFSGNLFRNFGILSLQCSHIRSYGLAVSFVKKDYPVVLRCNGTNAGLGYLEVDWGLSCKKIPCWAVSLCLHCQTEDVVTDSLHD